MQFSKKEFKNSALRLTKYLHSQRIRRALIPIATVVLVVIMCIRSNINSSSSRANLLNTHNKTNSCLLTWDSNNNRIIQILCTTTPNSSLSLQTIPVTCSNLLKIISEAMDNNNTNFILSLTLDTLTQ